MLWECEQKPPSWWSAESSLIKLCSSLLHKLSDSVTQKYCQHYFISTCNLIDHFVESASSTICSRLRNSTEESFLLRWFIKNYIRKCAEGCPANVSALFEDIQPCSDELLRAVHAATDRKLSAQEQELYRTYFKHELNILFGVQIYRADTAWIPALRKEQHNISLRLRDYYIAMASLQVAYKISIHSVTEERLEILWMISGEIGGRDTDKLESGELL